MRLPDRPDDYIAGFPPHPHRGFETVTYLLAGRMQHKDNAGHEGDRARRYPMDDRRPGIVHRRCRNSKQACSRVSSWANLPAKHKMTPRPTRNTRWRDPGRDT